jgi:2-polyprenyl-3-methyl-5-hydroxy-6-metoxy-1,4-benzoquinol methylase
MHDMSHQMNHSQFLAKNYALNATSGIWARPNYESIKYSDGDATETSIGNILSSTKDLSVLSPELRKHYTDWAHLYHLSSSRANVLRPFKHSLKGSVLEIGAGCGAITRFLGECGADVLALEGSLRRAGVARTRTRDLSNVTVLAERFADFNVDYQFDVITLIGVLEYANLFTGADNGPLAMLQKVRKLLKPEGRLIIAIENQLGLKYFAGANEDHMGFPMFGIEDRYTSKTVRTFGRMELSELLAQAGFPVTDFLACFPDYKLPASIVTSLGASTKSFDASALASQSVAKDHLKPEFQCFSPELAWPAIIRNGLGLDLANSFLVAAGASQNVKQATDILAYHYSSDRRPEFAKETIFHVGKSGEVKLSYKSLSSANEKLSASAELGRTTLRFDVPENGPYCKGKPLSEDFLKIVSKVGWTHESMRSYLKTYMGALSQFAGVREAITIDSQVSGRYVDCIPTNIIQKTDASLELIDTEWSISGDITVRWLMFRAILSLSALPSDFARDEFGKIFSHEEFFILCFGLLDHRLNRTSLMSLFEEEHSLQNRTSNAVYDQQMIETFLDKPMPYEKYCNVTAAYRDELGLVRAELQAITTSRKWRIALKISELTPTFLKILVRKLLPAKSNRL